VTSLQRRSAGFTLIELIFVLVLTTIIGGTVAVFVRPAIRGYTDTRDRSVLGDMGDTALRRMVRDIRMAVPNSLRTPNEACFELVPTVAGGRYRMGPNTANDAWWVDTSQATTGFDVLSTLSRQPAVGDFVVINNQNGNDVYSATNRATISAVATPTATQGTLRLTISSLQVSPGYDGGRFQVVNQNERSVFYVCDGAGLSADGLTGTGVLWRIRRDFNATYPTACPGTGGGTVLARNIRSCRFVYSPNQGATQQSGFVYLELAITRNGETATLTHGAHVLNAP
jgi:MSHA biogenesis protein MshO